MSLGKEIKAVKKAIEEARRSNESVPEDAFDTRDLEDAVAKEVAVVFETWKDDLIQHLRKWQSGWEV
jgi:hypothetical protein